MNRNGKWINMRQPTWPKSNLSRLWLDLKVLQTSKVLKLYTTLSATSTTNRFAPTFKWKLDRCTMNCDDHLRHFNKTSTNWHWMSCEKNACIRDKGFCMTCSNNKVWTLIFVKKIAHLTGGCVLKWENNVLAIQSILSNVCYYSKLRNVITSYSGVPIFTHESSISSSDITKHKWLFLVRN